MSVIIEKIRELKNTANGFFQSPKVQDWIATAYLCTSTAMLYWATSFVFVMPLLIFWKPPLGIVYLLYVCWIYYDRNTPKMGGRKSKWFCNLFFFHSLRHYFSNRLIKTADLPEGRNYILAHYPHGFTPMNVLPNFMSNSNRVADLFPGIEMQYVTKANLFIIPLLREFALATGGCSCSESSFTYLLKSTPSKGIVVAPGGLQEVRYTVPGNIYNIVKKTGFVRLALATGTPLVPVFTFGEINTWNKVIVVRILTEKMRKYLLRSTPNIFIPLGRGVLPKKSPVNTIVGAPISVPKVENPPQELIDEYCEKFYQALQDLFEQYKGKYDTAGENAQLKMLPNIR